MTSPFKFLDAYTPADRAVFFGREQEVEALYNLLFSTPLVLVHGLSGTGKTSLIQCGLAGRYEGPDWYPFFISRGLKDINESLRGELQKALPAQPVGDDLPGYIRQITEYYYSPVYLIFDQFEELFILGSPEERQQFADNLKAILDAELSCKVLLVMREEYLGRLYEMEQKIPFLFDFRLRVEPMNMTRVQQVLEQSFTAFNIALEPPPEERFREIIAKVSGERSGIELPYLQVYLDLLYKKDFRDTYPGRERNGQLLPLTLTRDKIEAFGRIEDVLEKFLLQQEQELQAALAAEHWDLPPNTVRQVLDLFVTDEGTKQPQRFQREPDTQRVELDERARKLVPQLSSAALSDALQALEQSRLLRFLEDTIELAHDKLAALIHAQRTEAQRRLARARARLKFALEEHQLSGAFLNREQLADLEQYLPQLHIEPDMQAFLAANRAFLTEEEAREKRRQRRFIAGVLLVALVSVVAAVVSYGYFLRAQAATELSEERRKTAERSDSLAQVKAAEALRSDSLARLRALEAQAAARTAEEQEAIAQAALRQSRITAGRTVPVLLNEADNYILALQYDTALVRARAAWDLNAARADVTRRFQEIAYFFTESGAYDKAVSSLAYTGRRAKPRRELLLAALENIDPEHLRNVLEPRYYPEMVEVPGGTFWMGCDTSLLKEDCNSDELPRHQVTLDDFRLARSETTVWQYYLYTKATGRPMPETPSWQWRGHHPIVNVSWYDALAYANWVSSMRGEAMVYPEIPEEPNELDGQVDSTWSERVNWSATGFRLPTEAEWEYAARGGQQSEDYLYAGSDSLDLVGWYSGNNDPYGAKAVKGKKPNELGIYDMSGNVWEWCWDWYGENYYATFQEVPNDPHGPKSASRRVLRGGSWYFSSRVSRVAYRYGVIPIDRDFDYGFRLAQD